MKKKITKAYCIPSDIANKVEDLADELGVSASAVVTMYLSVGIKFDLKEVFRDAVQRREA